ncbi:hypothetical protein DB42_AJ00050 [Neochlamydia sp. EPS4]|nr:hypothetical protein DB42_AJ00050 [Neochlamydia sp. EPS4]
MLERGHPKAYLQAIISYFINFSSGKEFKVSFSFLEKLPQKFIALSNKLK